MYKFIFYKDKNGNEPIKDYILDLEKKGRTINLLKHQKRDRTSKTEFNRFFRDGGR